MPVTNKAAPRLTKKLSAAFEFALKAHDGQTRKGTAIPYLSHPMGVASLVLEHGGTEDQAAAALLHDTVEDCDVTFADLDRRFGPAVARIVKDCTDAHTRPKPAWRKRKERYIDHLRRSRTSSLLVAAADKLHNVRAIVRDVRQLGIGVWARFNAPPAELVWYYVSLLGVFRSRSTEVSEPFGRLVGELAATIAEMRKLAMKYNLSRGKGA